MYKRIQRHQRCGIVITHQVGQRKPGRQVDQFTRTGTDVVVLEHVRLQPVVPRHLRDDLVTATFKAEAIDIIATKQGRQVTADVTHTDAQVTGAVTVDHQGAAWPAVLRSLHQKHKAATGHAAANQLVGNLVQFPETAFAGDNKLHRQATARTGQAGAREYSDLEAGDFLQLALQFGLYLHLRTRPERRGLHLEAAKGGGRFATPEQEETFVVLGDAFEGRHDLSRIGLVILYSRCLWPGCLEEQDALVLHRRQFALAGDEHEKYRCQYCSRKQQGGRQTVQHTVQQIPVAIGQSGEAVFDPLFKTALLAVRLEYSG